ncbi:hypothetical protein [Hymenobacter sp. BT559]|uniref:hypothetical protein n=1 Tax=Hymenobacter sp. BT559 TaxID=2795729 RepID=UPI0018EBA81F|nr:hypothetical protein [Hymenobacter sp. BT559]MBJ6141867.1 hypothetical protein [Hymenobacter sp. BT559]
MELDDLRRQWQQPEPTVPAAFNKAALAQLLAQQSSSILVKLRRNARLELAINYAILPVAVAVAGWAPMLWVRLFGGLLALLAVVCIGYFYRKLGLLRKMDNPDDDLRGHLLHITQGLRALIKFYYRLTLAMIPVTMLLNMVMVLTTMRGPVTTFKVSIIMAGLLLMSVLIYWPVAQGTHWYLQRLYGQHLDRLEGQLRELDEEAGPRVAESH